MEFYNIKDMTTIYENIANRSLNNAAILSTLDRIAFYNSKHIDDGNYLQTMNERVSVFPYVIYFPHHSCFRAAINVEIGLLSANGLLEKWHDNYINLKLVETKVMESDRIKIRQLKLFDIEGCLQICGYFYAIATVVFLLECLVKWIMNLYSRKLSSIKNL